MSDKLSAKIELWKAMNNYINKTEASYQVFYTLFVALAGVVISLYGGNVILTARTEISLILLIFLPIALGTVMAYLAYMFRQVAIARMYSTAIEKEINIELEDCVFVWNSKIIDQYIAKKNFPNTFLLPMINLIFFAFIGFLLNCFMFALDIAVWIKVTYLICIVALFVACLCPFLKNESIRTLQLRFDKKI